MAAFDYEALTADGRRTGGVISAESARAARQALRSRQLTPLNVRESGKAGKSQPQLRQRLTHKQRTLFTRQMAVLLQSGMTIEQALAAAAADGGAPAVRALILGVRARVMEGLSFADALRTAPAAFPQLYRSVVGAGESAGKLGAVLDQLSTNLERTYKMTSTAQAALVYPAVLAVMAGTMISALMVFVVPKLVEQFAMLGAAELPLLTRMVISFSEFVRNWGWLVALGLAGVVFLFLAALRQPHFKLGFDRFVLRLPLAGELLRGLSASRFARVFAILSGSGATVIEALSGARGAMGNLVFRNATTGIITQVQQGSSLSQSIRAAGIFPPLLMHMVQSGEAARDVPGMMTRAADFLDSEFEATTRSMLSLLEPAIIIILGGIVGTIVLSIMLPIMQLNTLALG